MRRPPDKAAPSMAGKDVESSNATLNAVFGGARQKSWMTAGTNVRPTPRASKPSMPTMLAHQTTPAVLPSPSPSNEPSPSLSHNEVPRRNDENRNSAMDSSQPFDTVRWGSPEHTAPQAIQTPPFTEVESGPSNPRAIPLQTPGGYRPTPVQNFESFSMVNEPTPGSRVSQPQHDQRPPAQEIQSPFHAEPRTDPRRPGSVNAALQSTVPQLHTEAPAHREDARGQRSSPIRVHSFSPESSFVNATLSATGMAGQSQFQSGAEKPPLPSSLLPSPAPPPSGEIYSPSDTLQHPIMSSGLPPLKSMVAVIKAHIAKAGGSENLNSSLERPRFQLLMEACSNQDIFYVVVHQLFCIWNYDRPRLLANELLPTRDVLSAAFLILGQLIRDNKGMAPNHLRWFSAFPAPLDTLFAKSEHYRYVVADVGKFFTKLASQWDNFSKQCQTRRYPPLVDELVNCLGILSPILQGVVFTATRRNLNIRDDPAIEEIFLEDKKGYQEHTNRYNAGRPPRPSEVAQRNEDLATRYWTIATLQTPQRGTHQRGSQAGGSSLSQTPMVPSAVPSQANSPLSRPPAASSRPFISSGDATRFSNSSPSSNQQTQPRRTTSAGSSNPTLVPGTGRTVSMTSSPSFSNVPSPTFMQNLSIQSPVTGSPTMPPAMQSSATPSPVQQGQHWIPVMGSNVAFSHQNLTPSAYSGHGQGVAVSQPPPFLDPMAAQRQQQHSSNFQPQQQQLPQEVLSLQYQQHVMPLQGQQLLQQPPQQGHQPQPRQHREPQYQAHSMNRAAPLRSISIPQPWSQPQNSSSSHSLSAGTVVSPSRQSYGPPPRRSTASVETMQHLTPHASHRPDVMQPLIPPVGYIHAPQAIDPDLTALHQAHVRSPRLVAAENTQHDQTPGEDVSKRFYQCVKEFALVPSKIPPTASVSNFTFTVSEQDLPLIAQDKWPTTDPLAIREFKQGTLQYRLRCTRSKVDLEDTARRLTADWSVTDTGWPEICFIQINGEDLDIRRKTHHGKDLPIDITRCIAAATPGHGSFNHVKISTPRSRRHKDQGVYFLAVEVVEILQHCQIIDMCHRQHIPASQTLESIKKSLAGPEVDDDDDFAMIVSDLSVDLADPFTARIFDVPVRGSSCLHRECFDLSAFLVTRDSKPKRPDQPCMVDVWKCPLCGQDARPYSLRIDDYFVAVRAKLAEDRSLDVKSIWISADGSWKPKADTLLKRKASSAIPDDEQEEGAAVKQRILDRAAASRAGSMEARRATQPVEIIELDDD